MGRLGAKERWCGSGKSPRRSLPHCPSTTATAMALGIGVRLPGVEDPLPDAGCAPPPVATVDGLPRAERLGEIVPRDLSLYHPEHAAEHGAVVGVRAAGRRLLRRHEWGNARPSLVPPRVVPRTCLGQLQLAVQKGPPLGAAVSQAHPDLAVLDAASSAATGQICSTRSAIIRSNDHTRNRCRDDLRLGLVWVGNESRAPVNGGARPSAQWSGKPPRDVFTD